MKDVVAFEVDLADVLMEREKCFARSLPAHSSHRGIPVSCDLGLQDLAQRLTSAGFDRYLNTLFMLEGLTMYLDAVVNYELFAAVGALSSSSGSRVWLDVVDQCVIDRTAPQPEVKAFLQGIEAIGEPFVWGPPTAPGYFERFGLEREREDPSDYYRPSDDLVFELYRFCILRSAPHSPGGVKRDHCEQGVTR